MSERDGTSNRPFCDASKKSRSFKQAKRPAQGKQSQGLLFPSTGLTLNLAAVGRGPGLLHDGIPNTTRNVSQKSGLLQERTLSEAVEDEASFKGLVKLKNILVLAYLQKWLVIQASPTQAMLNSCYFQIPTNRRSPPGRTGKGIGRSKAPQRLQAPLLCRRFTQNIADSQNWEVETNLIDLEQLVLCRTSDEGSFRASRAGGARALNALKDTLRVFAAEASGPFESSTYKNLASFVDSKSFRKTKRSRLQEPSLQERIKNLREKLLAPVKSEDELWTEKAEKSHALLVEASEQAKKKIKQAFEEMKQNEERKERGQVNSTLRLALTTLEEAAQPEEETPMQTEENELLHASMKFASQVVTVPPPSYIPDITPPFKQLSASPAPEAGRGRRKSDETFQSYISPSKVYGFQAIKGNSCSPIREESPQIQPTRATSRTMILVLPPRKPVPQRRHLPLGIQKMSQETRLPKQAARQLASNLSKIDQVLEEKLSNAPETSSDFAFQSKQNKMISSLRKEYQNKQEEGYSIRSQSINSTTHHDALAHKSNDNLAYGQSGSNSNLEIAENAEGLEEWGSFSPPFRAGKMNQEHQTFQNMSPQVRRGVYFFEEENVDQVYGVYQPKPMHANPTKRNYSITASGQEEHKIISLSKCAIEVTECQTQRVRGDESGRASRSSQLSPEEKANIENFYKEFSKNMASESKTKQFLTIAMNNQRSDKVSNNASEENPALRRPSLKVPSEFNSKQSSGSSYQMPTLHKSKTEARLDTYESPDEVKQTPSKAPSSVPKKKITDYTLGFTKEQMDKVQAIRDTVGTQNSVEYKSCRIESGIQSVPLSLRSRGKLDKKQISGFKLKIESLYRDVNDRTDNLSRLAQSPSSASLKAASPDVIREAYYQTSVMHSGSVSRSSSPKDKSSSSSIDKRRVLGEPPQPPGLKQPNFKIGDLAYDRDYTNLSPSNCYSTNMGYLMRSDPSMSKTLTPNYRAAPANFHQREQPQSASILKKTKTSDLRNEQESLAETKHPHRNSQLPMSGFKIRLQNTLDEAEESLKTSSEGSSSSSLGTERVRRKTVGSRYHKVQTMIRQSSRSKQQK